MTVRKETRDLPFILGKTYITKFATKEHFTITSIKLAKDGKQILRGVYENSPNLLDCPIDNGRLIADSELTGQEIEYHVCPHCNKTYE